MTFKKIISALSTIVVTAAMTGCGNSEVASGIDADEEIIVDTGNTETAPFEKDIDEPVFTAETSAEASAVTSEVSETTAEVSDTEADISSETVTGTAENTTAAVTAETVTEAYDGCADPDRNSGTTLRIASFNNEFEAAFDALYGREKLPSGINLEFEIIDRYSYDYFKEIEQGISDDEPVDIFIVETDDLLKVIDKNMTLPMNSAGIFADADMFDYTVQQGTNSQGVLKAVTWQTTPGIFMYRRDIAKEVFGNDSPEYIEKLISEDWDNACKKLKENGYYMLPSSAEAYRVYEQSRSAPWISGGKIKVDPMVRLWAEDMRTQVENGWNMNATMWSDVWVNELTVNGSSFGAMTACWYSDGVLSNIDTDGAGLWGICQPPEPFYWGGSYMCIGENCDNIDLCRVIISDILDSENYEGFSAANAIYPNNRSILSRLAENSFSDYFAQNTLAEYLEASEKISISDRTVNDFAIGECYIGCMADFISGSSSYEDAEEYFLGQAVTYIEN